MTDDNAAGESGLEDWSQDQFAFLTDHGFAVDRVTQHTIQWRKGERTIELSRDWRDGQVDLRFACGSDAPGRKTFGLHHALQVLAPEAWPSHGWQAWQQSTTRRYIAELAALVNAHLGAFLATGLSSGSKRKTWHATRHAYSRRMKSPARCGVRQMPPGRPGIG